MAERLYVGAYWGGRRESASACAERASLFFRELGELRPSLKSWYLKGATRKEARDHPINPEPTELRRLMELGVNQTDVDRAPIRELGFTLSAWTGLGHDESSTLRITCGSSSNFTKNACVLELPRRDRFTVEEIVPIVDLFIRAWDPDLVNVNSAEHRRMSGKVEGVSAVGWVFFLSHRRGRPPVLHPPSRTIAHSRGAIIIVTPEQFSSTNEDHVSTARSVATVLSQKALSGL